MNESEFVQTKSQQDLILNAWLSIHSDSKQLERKPQYEERVCTLFHDLLSCSYLQHCV